MSYFDDPVDSKTFFMHEWWHWKAYHLSFTCMYQTSKIELVCFMGVDFSAGCDGIELEVVWVSTWLGRSMLVLYARLLMILM
jgi:hypothetical protein